MFRFAGSVLLRGGRGAADRYRRVWGALAVFRPRWVCPRSRVCAFPVYTAQAPGCSIWSGPCVARSSSFRVLHNSADSVGHAFCAFPTGAAHDARSLPGALSSVRCAFSPPRPQPQFPRVPVGCVQLVSILGSWLLAATLPADVDHPESQEVFG